MVHQGFWGVDGGAYLLSANWVMGDEPTSADFPRPPLAPGLLMVPFVTLLGPDAGLKVFAAFPGILLGLAFIPFARAFLSPNQTLIGLLFVSLDFMMAEMWAAGPLPQVGFAGLLLAFLSITRISQGRMGYQGLLVLSIPFIALTNQTAAGISLVVLPVYILVTLLQNPNKHTLSGALALPLLLGIAFSLPLLPYYIGVTPGSTYTAYQDSLIRGIVGLDHAVWVYNILAIAFGILVLRLGPPHIGPLVVVMWILGILSPWLSNDEALQNIFYRSRYFIMIPLYVVGIAAISRLMAQKALWLGKSGAMLVRASTVYLLLALVGGFLYQAITESKALTMVSADGKAAIEFLKEANTEGHLVFTNSYPVSLYLAAVTKAPTAWTASWIPPKRYEQNHYDGLCLLNWLPGCNPQESAERLGAGYILADEKWPNSQSRIWLQPSGKPWGLTEKARWLEPMFEKGTVKVWKVQF